MNSITLRLLGATALVAMAAPALAEKSDRVFLDEVRAKIATARAEPGVAEHGGAELDRADDALRMLSKDLDDNETKRVESDMTRINALIDTARARAKVVSLKSEVEQLRTAGAAANQARVADAENAAANAQADAAAARAEAARLRTAMRDYQMKQTQLGATLVLQDVVFETGKADLKPGASQRLRPLASYLQANPNVRVRVDAHTDAQGSDAYNQALSQRRAASVRAALASLGVDGGRIEMVGHGEAQPIADNRTPAGRQQNRRVEVTLMGQQASTFAGTQP